MMAPPAGALAGAAARRAGAVAGHVAPGDEPAGRPPFRAGGRLAVRDARTGDEHEVAVTAGGTLSGADLRKITPPPGTDVAWGLRVYDPGYVNTVAVRSKVSYIDGGRGVLRYRGYPIEELAENSSFLETAYLVIYGHLPSQEQAGRWEEAVMRHSALPEGVQQCIAALPHDSHPMGVMMTGMAALGAFHPEANPAIAGNGIYKGSGGHAVRDKQIVRILGKAPALAAAAYHRKTARRPHSRAWDTPRASCTCSTPPRTAARATGPTPDWPRHWTSCLCCMRSTR